MSQITKNRMLEATYLQILLHSVKEHQPEWSFAIKSNPGIFTTLVSLLSMAKEPFPG